MSKKCLPFYFQCLAFLSFQAKPESSIASLHLSQNKSLSFSYFASPPFTHIAPCLYCTLLSTN